MPFLPCIMSLLVLFWSKVGALNTKIQRSTGTICYECYDLDFRPVCKCVDPELWTQKETTICKNISSVDQLNDIRCPSVMEASVAIGISFIVILIIAITAVFIRILQINGNCQRKREIKKIKKDYFGKRTPASLVVRNNRKKEEDNHLNASKI